MTFCMYVIYLLKELSPSATVPPNDAPKWVIKTDTSEHSNYYIIINY